MQTLKERYEHKMLSLLAEDISKQNLEFSSKYQRILNGLNAIGLFTDKISTWKAAIKEKFLSAKTISPSELGEKFFRGDAGQAISVVDKMTSMADNLEPLLVSILADGDKSKFDSLDKTKTLEQLASVVGETKNLSNGLVKLLNKEGGFWRKVANLLPKTDAGVFAKQLITLTLENVLKIPAIVADAPPPPPTETVDPKKKEKEAAKKINAAWKKMATDMGYLIKGKKIKDVLASPEGQNLMDIIKKLQAAGLLKEALRRGAIKLDIINEFKYRR